jgi:hypothetical protein
MLNSPKEVEGTKVYFPLRNALALSPLYPNSIQFTQQKSDPHPLTHQSYKLINNKLGSELKRNK